MKDWEKRLKELKKDYLEYLNSDEWKSKSKRWREGELVKNVRVKDF